MRWQGERESDNVEDRRRMGAPTRGVAIGGGGLLLLLAFALLTGEDPIRLLETVTGPQTSVEQGQAPGEAGAPQDQLGRFASVVLASTEDVWQRQFAGAGKRYRVPTLVLFSSAVESACGFSSAAVGPFYCPGDSKVYVDLSFFDELQNRFGAPGDFAQAYVIAHEVGHHVQTLTGVSEQVNNARLRGQNIEGDNGLLVRQELQADCYAGLWAYHAQQKHQWLEAGDIEEALNTASAIGDDRLQKQSQGTVVPDAFTHGTAAQRTRWFKRGFDTGNVEDCDTFAAKSL